MKTKFSLTLCFIILHSAFCLRAPAQGTAFTYQGRLNDGANPANGAYDLQFTIYDALASGIAVAGPTVADDVTVSNGLFTVTLDFGAVVFSGADRWLEIGVRPGANSGSYSNLSPRQLITSAPYAIRAASYSGAVAASQLTGTISSNNISPGTITGNMLAAGSVTGNSLADGAVSLEKLDAVPVPLGFITLSNPTPDSTEYFGTSVAAVGSDRVLVGAPYADSDGVPDVGEAYLFNANGILLTTLTNPESAFFGYFGGAVASAGESLLLIGDSSAGKAYLFSTNGALITTFTDPVGGDNHYFGSAVAAVGTDKVLIGASGDGTGAPIGGAAYLFSTNGALLLTYTNPAPSLDDYFGISVAALGSDRVLIGTYLGDEGGGNAGGAYLYDTNGTLLTTFTNPVPATAHAFGRALAALGNDRVLIGAPDNSVGGAFAGNAYLFSTNGTLLMTFTNPAPGYGDSFGALVSAVGTDKVLIGAFGDDTGATDAGSAYLFDTNGTLLAAFANPTPEVDDAFGLAVAGLGSDRVIIGASQDGTGGSRVGAAYVYNTTELGALMSSLFAGGVAAGAVTPAMLSTDVGVWTRSGFNLFYTDGNVGVGTNAPTSRLHVNGTVTATAFSGSGSGLTGLNASQLTSGTVPSARIAGTYSGAVTFGNAANSFSGSGAGLTALNASQLTTGTVPLARLPAAVVTNNQSAVTLAGTFSGNGSGLTGLDASQLTSGTVPSARIAGTYSGAVTFNNAANSFSGSGAGLTALNASQLTSGTVSLARLPAAVVTNNQSAVTLTGTFSGNGGGLTTLDASQLTSGTVPDARLSTNVALLDRSSQSFAGVNSFMTNVGIGTNTPLADLHIVGTDTRLRLQSSGSAGHSATEYVTDARVWHTGVGGSITSGGLSNKYYIADATAGQARLVVNTSGDVGIGTTAPTNRLHVIGGVSATAFVSISDRNAKENFAPVSPLEVLNKVTAMPITTWNFKDMKDGRHMGPMAQDFYSAFGLGGSDTTITSVDPDGVALAAIQGLNEKVEAGSQKSEDRIQKLESENAELRSRLQKLETAVQSRRP